MGFIQSSPICNVCIPLPICRYVATFPAPFPAPGFTICLGNSEWLTSEGIIPTSDAPVVPTPVQTPAIPPTPELSNASTPANTTNTTSTFPTPSDRGKKRARREVVSGLFCLSTVDVPVDIDHDQSVSNINEQSEPDTPIACTSAQMPYPGQSFMWFNDSPFAFTHEKAQELQEHAQEKPTEPPATNKRQRRK